MRGTSVTSVLGGTRYSSVLRIVKNNAKHDFSLRRIHCNGVVLVASTSISNTRVQVLLLALVRQCVAPLLSTNHIFTTIPPLRHLRVIQPKTGGRVHCACSSRRVGGLISSLRGGKLQIGSPVRQCGNLNRVSTDRLQRAAVSPAGHRLQHIAISSTSTSGSIFHLLVNGRMTPHGNFVIRSSRTLSHTLLSI